MKKARKAFKIKWYSKVTEVQLVVYGDEVPNRLAWKFIVKGREPEGRKDVYVDAITGEIILEYIYIPIE